MKSFFSQLFIRSFLVAALSTLCIIPAQAKESFKLCWSIYVGWMPWEYGDSSGIIDKWAKKYDIDIEVVQINDYIESINQYSAGAFDACAMTNMDALTIPSAGGVDSTALIVGDFSNGNDAVILKEKTSIEDIKGQRVNLVELSVSHYLLARALDSVGLSERDVQVVNTSDADMVAAYGTDQVTAVSTWNPLVNEILNMPKSNQVFDSSQIPGEIIDLLVVHTETLDKYPAFGKALVGAWYEIMEKMQGDESVREHMGIASGADLARYESQLASTKMFYQPGDAVEFVHSPELKKTMADIAEFSFDHGLLGEGAPDAQFIGIETPAGIYGNAANVMLRFNPEYMQLAADDKL
ncbi:putative urea ABC transporter substrate-binding protein [Microbulbifer rhizosphaerae]|nr:putative urea ABC transporter substrate-binding protein [Microbulbifer rhizosphaerae]